MGPRGRQGVEEAVAGMARAILARRGDGLTLDRVEFTREGGQWFLRVYLDHPRGVTLDHCQEVSRELSDALDAADPVPHSYNLEVSSPGVERPLTRDADFERFRGHLATLHLYRPRQGRKVLTGHLGGLTPEGEIVLELEPEGPVRVPRREVAKAHLAVDWGGTTGRAGRSKSGRNDSGGGSQ